MKQDMPTEFCLGNFSVDGMVSYFLIGFVGSLIKSSTTVS